MQDERNGKTVQHPLVAVGEEAPCAERQTLGALLLLNAEVNFPVIFIPAGYMVEGRLLPNELAVLKANKYPSLAYGQCAILEKVGVERSELRC